MSAQATPISVAQEVGLVPLKYACAITFFDTMDYPLFRQPNP